MLNIIPAPTYEDLMQSKYKILVKEVLTGSEDIGERIIGVDHGPCGMLVNPNEEWVFFLYGGSPIGQCQGHVQLDRPLDKWVDGYSSDDLKAYRRYSNELLTALRDAKVLAQRRKQKADQRALTARSPSK